MNKYQENFIAKFYTWINKNKTKSFNWINEQRSLIEKFNAKFDINFIKNMTLEQYAIGRQNSDSFCYWVERKIEIEDIRNPSGAAGLYGIYWNKKNNHYEFKTRFGSTKEEVFNSIKNEILSLMISIKNNDIYGIANNKLSPPFKGKLAFLYNWKNTVAIHSNDHLYSILTYLGIKTHLKEKSEKEPCENRFSKRQKLFNFVKVLGIPEMDSVVLDSFLYDEDGDGYRDILYSKETSKYIENSKKIECIIAQNVTPIIRTPSSNERSGKIKLNIEAEIQKGITGEMAEQHVLDYLNKHKIDFDICGEIIKKSDTDDYAHYDITYKTSSGEQIFIEVKSSSCDLGKNVVFFMSDSEYKYMMEHKNNYKLFFVNNVANSPTIIIFNPTQITVKPVKYISELNFK